MSVLLKALEKAAQDRDKAPVTEGGAASSNSELSLEAIEPKLSSPAGNPIAGARAATVGNRTSAQANAANLIAARNPRNGGAIAWIRDRPMYFFGACAGLFLLVYAAYVYVQITHPGLLVNRLPQPVAAAIPAATDPNTAAIRRDAPERAPAARAPASDAPESQLIPLQSVFNNRGDRSAAQELPGPSKDGAGRIAAPANVPTTTAAAAAAPRQTGAPVAAPTVPPTAPQNRIAINRGDNAAPRVAPALSEAYAALMAGQFDTAQRLYGQVLRNEPANIDALLGLASLAQKDNRAEDAQRYFLAILDVEPRNALAQSGLIALTGRADPQAAESRLKQLLAREPSPPLYFNLGNLYAEQGQWSQAQQAYFQAHTLDPQNPDYAYNLAVGLEHLSQQKLALGFYRKALQLASTKGAANFDTARIQDRIAQLSPRFD